MTSAWNEPLRLLGTYSDHNGTLTINLQRNDSYSCAYLESRIAIGDFLFAENRYYVYLDFNQDLKIDLREVRVTFEIFAETGMDAIVSKSKAGVPRTRVSLMLVISSARGLTSNGALTSRMVVHLV